MISANVSEGTKEMIAEWKDQIVGLEELKEVRKEVNKEEVPREEVPREEANKEEAHREEGML